MRLGYCREEVREKMRHRTPFIYFDGPKVVDAGCDELVRAGVDSAMRDVLQKAGGEHRIRTVAIARIFVRVDRRNQKVAVLFAVPTERRMPCRSSESTTYEYPKAIGDAKRAAEERKSGGRRAASRPLRLARDRRQVPHIFGRDVDHLIDVELVKPSRLVLRLSPAVRWYRDDTSMRTKRCRRALLENRDIRPPARGRDHLPTPAYVMPGRSRSGWFVHPLHALIQRVIIGSGHDRKRASLPGRMRRRAGLNSSNRRQTGTAILRRCAGRASYSPCCRTPRRFARGRSLRGEGPIARCVLT